MTAIKYIFISLVVFVLAGCGKDPLPSLEETYERADKLPFGAFVAYHALESTFKERLMVSGNSLSAIRDFSERRNLYLIIAQNLPLTRGDARDFLTFVEGGNDLFISADFIDPKFLNEINCSSMRIAEIYAESKGEMRNTFVSPPPAVKSETVRFSYYYYPFLNYFPHYDKRRSALLGTNEAGLPNFIVYSRGGGRVFVHLAPRALSNYFLLKGENYKYLQDILHTISPNINAIYWDEYYKRGENLNKRDPEKANEKFSALRVIKREPALLWAFWLGVAAILLFVIFKIKRRQRMVPEVAPPQNATVEFTETIAALYLQNKDNKIMAEKAISWFYENISSKYYVGGGMNQTAIFKAWAQKKGAGDSKVNRLLDLIANVRQNETLSDRELMELNALLDEFKN